MAKVLSGWKSIVLDGLHSSELGLLRGKFLDNELMFISCASRNLGWARQPKETSKQFEARVAVILHAKHKESVRYLREMQRRERERKEEQERWKRREEEAKLSEKEQARLKAERDEYWRKTWHEEARARREREAAEGVIHLR